MIQLHLRKTVTVSQVESCSIQSTLQIVFGEGKGLVVKLCLGGRRE